MIGTWMVTLNGWLLLLGAAFAAAGVLLVVLVVRDEIALQKQRKEIRRRGEERRAKAILERHGMSPADRVTVFPPSSDANEIVREMRRKRDDRR